MCIQQFKWSDKNILHLNFKNPLPLISLVHSVMLSPQCSFFLLCLCVIVVMSPSSSVSIDSVQIVHTTVMIFHRRDKFFFLFSWFIIAFDIRVTHTDYPYELYGLTNSYISYELAHPYNSYRLVNSYVFFQYFNKLILFKF